MDHEVSQLMFRRFLVSHNASVHALLSELLVQVLMSLLLIMSLFVQYGVMSN